VTLQNGERCHGRTENIRGCVDGRLEHEHRRGRDGRHCRTVLGRTSAGMELIGNQRESRQSAGEHCRGVNCDCQDGIQQVLWPVCPASLPPHSLLLPLLSRLRIPRHSPSRPQASLFSTRHFPRKETPHRRRPRLKAKAHTRLSVGLFSLHLSLSLSHIL